VLFVGIDPGIRGAISGLDVANKILWATEMPIIEHPKKKTEYDIPRIAALLKVSRADRICLEAVHSMPGQGVSSTFLFGKGFGILLGVVGTLGIPLTLVAPRTWKAKYLLGTDKNISRERATELFPQCANFWKLKKHDGLAEAAIMAHYICDVDDLDVVAPGDISELYNIESNIRGRNRKR
jgi:crossover junction endodeoxyribonuclease RuvC